MIPPHQRLRPRQAVVIQAVFRLKIDNELALSQGGLHGVCDRLLPQELSPQGIVINRKVPVVVSFDAVCRQQRPVTHLFHRNGAVPDLINAPLYGYIFHFFVVFFVIFPEKAASLPFLLFPLLEEQEAVRAVPAADAVLAHHSLHICGVLLQQAVSRLPAKGVII